MALYNINSDVGNEAANEMINNAKAINSAKETIQYALNEIKEAWEQDSPDASTYTNAIEKNISDLAMLVENSNEFASAIICYCNATKQISNRSVS